ncbi:MAG: coniferyl aldehyde dehydrogenase [Hyphomonadaceae bacterium]|nr:coniferyl aldehyde dehydrogenase [Hyphomonadaceae bacterium]
MNAMSNPLAEDAKARMEATLARQKAAHIREGAPSKAKRIDRLNRCIAILVDHSEELLDALNSDFGARSKDAGRLTDIAGSIGPLKYARDNLGSWMKSEKRKVEAPLNLFGARAEVRFQPKGVIGIISPWNFPVNLTFAPLAGVLAAGNRAMVKPSELTPATSDALLRLIDLYFDEEEIAVITGGPDVGAAFSGLAFDHLVFTGGTSIAYHVMRAASANLVPLTLELGGKSPVIVGKGADMEKSAARIMNGKTLNAGQICLAPDYVMVPKGQEQAFVSAATSAVTKMFPTLKDNEDYTAIINQRHYDRIRGLVDDARAKGAQVVEINPAKEDFSQQEHRRIPPTLILDATDDMKVMQEEIFGPVLPVRSYTTTEEAVAYVNAHDRPLGLYYFGEDEAEREMVLARTTSGGVTVNDVVFHVAQEDLPFGGIGPAGMGSYHGRDGFLEFSHKKAVYTQIKSEILAITRPPFGKAFRQQIGGRIKK